MKLHERALLERWRDPRRIDPLLGTPGCPDALQAIKENQSLAGLKPPCPDAPTLAAILGQTYLRVQVLQEQPLSWLPWPGRPRNWVLGAAAGLALVALVVCAAWFWPGRATRLTGRAPAYAATEGFVLALEIPNTGSAKTAEGMAGLIDQIGQIVDQVRRDYGRPGQENSNDTWSQLVVMGNGTAAATRSGSGGDPGTAGSDPVKLAFSFPAGTPALQQALLAALAQVPGLPAPEVAQMTWFSADGQPQPAGSGFTLELAADGLQHQFTFPPGAGEAEMEQSIQTWLSRNRPDLDFETDVQCISDQGVSLVAVVINATQAQAADRRELPPGAKTGAQDRQAQVPLADTTADAEDGGLFKLNLGEQVIAISRAFEGLSALFITQEPSLVVVREAEEGNAGAGLSAVQITEDGQVREIDPLQLWINVEGEPGVYVIDEYGTQHLTSEHLQDWLKEHMPDWNGSAEIERIMRDGAVELRILLEKGFEELPDPAVSPD